MRPAWMFAGVAIAMTVATYVAAWGFGATPRESLAGACLVIIFLLVAWVLWALIVESFK